MNINDIIPPPEKVSRRRTDNQIIILCLIFTVLAIGLILDLGVVDLCSNSGADCLARSGALLVFISVSATFINYYVQSEEKVASNLLTSMADLPTTPSELPNWSGFTNAPHKPTLSEEDAVRFINSLHFQEVFYRSRVANLRIFGQDLLGFEILAVSIGTLIWGFGDLDSFRYVAFAILVGLLVRISCLSWGLCKPSEDKISRL